MKLTKKFSCGCLSAALIVASLAGSPANVQAASPKLNKTSATLAVGKKVTLKVQNIKKGAAIKWSSTDKSIAAVSSKGVVTAKAAGKAIVKATVSKKTLKCKITVEEESGSSTNSKDISELLAGKSYKGTAGTDQGSMDVMTITFNEDGTAEGSKLNESTFEMEEFSGTYKAVVKGKKVTITVKAGGKTFSETLTLDKDDYTSFSTKKNMMGMDITLTVEEV